MDVIIKIKYSSKINIRLNDFYLYRENNMVRHSWYSGWALGYFAACREFDSCTEHIFVWTTNSWSWSVQLYVFYSKRTHKTGKIPGLRQILKKNTRAILPFSLNNSQTRVFKTWLLIFFILFILNHNFWDLVHHASKNQVLISAHSFLWL